MLFDDDTIISLGVENIVHTVPSLSTGFICELYSDKKESNNGTSVEKLDCNNDSITLKVLDVEHASSGDNLINQSNIPTNIATVLLVSDGDNSMQAISTEHIAVQKDGIICVHLFAC